MKLVYALTLSLLAGCGGGSDTTTSPAAARSTFSIAGGASVDVPAKGGGPAVDVPASQLSIKFAAVNDGRCPVDVQCVQAGEARVTLQVAAPNVGAKSLVLVTPASATDAGSTYAGFRLSLLSLTPLPSTAVPVSLGSYVAVVRVEPL
jgi:hypothetical protein